MSTALPHGGLASDLPEFLNENAPPATAPVVAQEEQLHLLLFSLGEDLFALPVGRLREVVRPNALARIPQAPPHVRGVQSLRGQILPVLETRTRIELSPAVLQAESRVLVVEALGRLLGLLVDTVIKVCRVGKSSLRPPPAEVSATLSSYVISVVEVDGRLALLLDIDRLISLPAPQLPSSRTL